MCVCVFLRVQHIRLHYYHTNRESDSEEHTEPEHCAGKVIKISVSTDVNNIRTVCCMNDKRFTVFLISSSDDRKGRGRHENNFLSII